MFLLFDDAYMHGRRKKKKVMKGIEVSGCEEEAK